MGEEGQFRILLYMAGLIRKRLERMVYCEQWPTTRRKA